MRSLKRKPDDRRDRYTAQRLMCIQYCTEEHGHLDDCKHDGVYVTPYECWQDTLDAVLDMDDKEELSW